MSVGSGGNRSHDDVLRNIDHNNIRHFDFDDIWLIYNYCCPTTISYYIHEYISSSSTLHFGC